MREFIRPVAITLGIVCLSASMAVLSTDSALAQGTQNGRGCTGTSLTQPLRHCADGRVEFRIRHSQIHQADPGSRGRVNRLAGEQ